MLGLEKSIVERLFDETIRNLDWRRLVLWREIDRLQSDLPGEAQRARSRVNRLQKELESDFKQAHKILAERNSLKKQSQKPRWKVWGMGVFLFFFLTIPPAWAGGIVSQGLDLTGEIIALPFRIVGEAFRLVF